MGWQGIRGYYPGVFWVDYMEWSCSWLERCPMDEFRGRESPKKTSQNKL